MLSRWPDLIVLGHGFADTAALPVPLPTLLAAAVVVAMGAAALPNRRMPVAAPLADRTSPTVRGALRALAMVGMLVIALVAALGPSDVALNPAPRLLFTVGWAGLLLISGLLGPWWRHASPLTAVAGGGESVEPARSVWPAVLGLGALGIFELVVEPSPMVALAALTAYLAAGSAVAVRGGPRGLTEADPLQVTSAALGSMAPLARGSGWLRSPRQGVGAHPAVPGLAAFLGVLAGMNLFDALELQGSPLVQGAVYLAVVTVAAAAFWAAARPAFLAPALIPAVAGHLGAHYLFPLLVDTQVAAVLASDPLRRGWNLLGITGAEINAEPIPGQLGLALQLLLLVAGHALAMVVAGDLAFDRLPPRTANATLFGVRAVILLSLVAGVYLRFGGAA